ncbi:coiled-coil domain-containing protein 106-like [Centropristis striata]|nr:coiled-coil domain-containing protein 106-like [Centropristis striata]
MMDSSDSDDDDTTSDTDEDLVEVKAKMPKKKIGKHRLDKNPKASFGRRASNPDDVLHRYTKILAEFRKHRSVGLACRKFGIDRNTIALTGIIAEMKIAGPEKMPPFDDGDTLAGYSKKCKAVLQEDEELMKKIDSMKKTADLLPIAHKFNK